MKAGKLFHAIAGVAALTLGASEVRAASTLDPVAPEAPAAVTPAPAEAPAQPAYPSSGPAAYRALFAAVDAQSWTEARGRALALSESDPVRAVALAEIYTARNSPKVALFDLLDLVGKSSWLPQAEQLSRMAAKRGAQTLPDLPQTQKLVWLGAASRREYVPTTKQDAAAQSLITQLQTYIRNDDAAGAEALVASNEAGLSPDGQAEVRARVAWSYYIENDDASARRMALRAMEAGSGNRWTTQAWWTIGLAAWRQNDPRAAADAFRQVATRADNDDMAAAGAYWAARAHMNAGEPEKVKTLLRLAAQREDTFYGLMARETLGIAPRPESARTAGWNSLRDMPAIRAAIALQDIGEEDLADELIRRQAELGGSSHYDQLVALSRTLGLAETQLWLAHHGPAGYKPDLYTRFPTPRWRPDGGWRVDPALVYAHALQESGFRPRIVSPAGARGVMQVMPGTAALMAGSPVGSAQLDRPSVNIEYGQRYLEMLRDNGATGGLLPKVMAAYNAGPGAVARWNTQVQDKGDPLLFIESLPFYETRAYVNIVMRNYWVYQAQQRGSAEALTTMAQGKWPRFPTGARVATGGSASPAVEQAAARTSPTGGQLSYTALASEGQ